MGNLYVNYLHRKPPPTELTITPDGSIPSVITKLKVGHPQLLCGKVRPSAVEQQTRANKKAAAKLRTVAKASAITNPARSFNHIARKPSNSSSAMRLAIIPRNT